MQEQFDGYSSDVLNEAIDLSRRERLAAELNKKEPPKKYVSSVPPVIEEPVNKQANQFLLWVMRDDRVVGALTNMNGRYDRYHLRLYVHKTATVAMPFAHRVVIAWRGNTLDEVQQYLLDNWAEIQQEYHLADMGPIPDSVYMNK